MADRTPEERLMMRAVALAKRGFPAPNPRVGCVIARGAEIVGEGHHDHAGAPHAEVVALRMAGERAKGSDVYVTLEPCNHFGRTPPCSRALVDAGVGRVWIGARDPNVRAGGGVQALSEAGVGVHVGLLAHQAELVNHVYLTAVRRQAPYVAAKLATTLDGFVARPDGSSKWITGPQARRTGHRLRAEMGSVLVGRSTVEIDRPRLTARIPGVVNQPVRVVLDPRGKLDGVGLPFSQQGSTLWIVSEDAPEGRGTVRLPASSGRFDPESVLRTLWEREILGVLIEGGPTTVESFLAGGLVDRFDLFIAPQAFGEGVRAIRLPGSGQVDLSLRLASCKAVGTDAWLVFVRS